MDRRVAIFVFVIVLVGAAATGARASARAMNAASATGVADAEGLPSGFEWPAGDAARPVVRAVAADIDDDGDLDVVANDGTPDLAVWVNDGTGRLTRAEPRPAGPRLAADAPMVANPARDAQLPAPTSAPAFDAALTRGLCAPLAGAGCPNGPPRGAAVVQLPSVRSPRAPPLASSL